MTLTTLFAAGLALCFGAGPLSIAVVQSGPKQDVIRLVEEAAGLLRRQDYSAFIKKAVRPSEARELVEKYGSIENAGTAIGQTSRPAKLIKVLEAALPLEPSFNAAKDRATFVFREPIEGERQLTLQKIGTAWYVRN